MHQAWWLLIPILLVSGWHIFMLVVCRLEPRQVLTLAPLPPEDPRAASRVGAKIVDQAQAAGFTLIGAFEARDSGWIKGVTRHLISPESETLLFTVEGLGSCSYRLVTALTTGKLMVTGNVMGLRDITGQRDEVMVPSRDFAIVYGHHRQRIAPMLADVIPFSPTQTAADHMEHDRERASRMIAMGLARWRDGERMRWKVTWRGATRMYGRRFKLRDVSKAGELAKQLEKRAEQTMSIV
jgi:hypothetical protein